MINDVLETVHELLSTYTSLHITGETDECVDLLGVINVHRMVDQFVLNKNYEIQVCIPKQKGQLPYVIDVGKAIDTNYPHLYKSGKLCLATDIDMQLSFCKDPSLVKWMRNYVETYFVSYEYYERYGVLPMGERPHGSSGIVQSYMEVFGVGKTQAALIIRFLSNKAYSGNQPCPCGSGIRMRKCHGKGLLKFYNNPILQEQARTDWKMIVQEEFQNEFAQ